MTEIPLNGLPTLDRLIAAVTAGAAADDPLDQLAVAARARVELDGLTDALLDHFVERAREAGCSWSQIGDVLGVSKQAAQQRHRAPETVARQLIGRLSGRGWSGRGLFTRFTAGARATVVNAQVTARRLGHPAIGPEHVLLGLLADPDGAAARALGELGVTGATVEATVVARHGRSDESPRGHIPFTPAARKTLELALREALRLQHRHIGGEHIVLALLREGSVLELLAAQGVGADRVHEALRRALAG